MREHLNYLPAAVPNVPDYRPNKHSFVLVPVQNIEEGVEAAVHAAVWTRYLWWLNTDAQVVGNQILLYIDPDIIREARECAIEKHGIDSKFLRAMPEGVNKETSFILDKSFKHHDWIYWVTGDIFVGRRYTQKIKPKHDFFQRWDFRRTNSPGVVGIKRVIPKADEFRYMIEKGVARHYGADVVYNRYTSGEHRVWMGEPGLFAWNPSRVTEQDYGKRKWIENAAEGALNLSHFISFYQEIWGTCRDIATSTMLRTFKSPKEIPEDFKGSFLFDVVDPGRGKVAWYREVGIAELDADIRILEGSRHKRKERAKPQTQEVEGSTDEELEPVL